MVGHLPPGQAEPSPAVDGLGRVLVAGVGNVFLGDDGFGSEVARQLIGSPLPAGVVVTDYGIRGMHLAYDLLDGWDMLVLIDLLPTRGRPGAVHIVEVDLEAIAGQAPDPHGMAPHAVLSAVGSMGGTLPPTVLIGCEPEDTEERLGLSPIVAAAVQPAVAAVLKLCVEGIGSIGERATHHAEQATDQQLQHAGNMTVGIRPTGGR
ncbi:MAG: hydrogenase maturation protease [Nakamurella sp.]